MSDYRRFAIYFLPEPGDALGAFGANWLGWDVETGQPATLTGSEGLPIPQAEIVSTPTRYGFHGTLKPPFRTGADIEQIVHAAERVASDIAPFNLPPMVLRPLGRFLALVPQEPSKPLSHMAFSFVQGVDDHRLAPTEAELAKRRANGLTDRQEQMLAMWGYPYVGPEFRFHLTLSGRLEPDVIQAVATALAPVVEPFAVPRRVASVGLCGEIDGGPHDGRFALIRRVPLTG